MLNIDMKEQELIDLGFTKEFCDNFYYYVYDFTRGFSLITNANDELINGNWVVEVFETSDKIQFTNIDNVKKLIKLINKAKK
jgi:hypothetical protein